MKKFLYVSSLVVLITIVVVWGIREVEHPAMAQVAGGQNYYTYHTLNTANATTEGVVWETGADERFTIHSLFINGPVAMEVQLLDGGTEIMTCYYAVNGGACPILDLMSAAKGNDLEIRSNVAGQISITAIGNSVWH